MASPKKGARPSTPSNTAKSPSGDDFFNEDLSTFKTSFPMLREGPIEVEFASVEKTESNAGDPMAVFLFKTAVESVDMDGRKQNAGYPLRIRVMTEVTEDRPADKVRGQLARICQAFKRKTVTQLRPGDRCIAILRNTRERTDEKTGRTYDPATEIKSLKPLK